MDAIIQKIADEHRALVDRMKRPATYSGIVKSVDTGKKTAMVALTHYDDGMAVEVLLTATKSSAEGLIVYPAVDSDIIVADVDGDGIYTVVRYGKITKIEVASAIDVLINNGENGGLVKVNELVTKLNNLENDVNNLKTVFSSWTPVPNDGGAALKAVVTSWSGASLTPTMANDLQNNKVKH